MGNTKFDKAAGPPKETLGKAIDSVGSAAERIMDKRSGKA